MGSNTHKEVFAMKRVRGYVLLLLSLVLLSLTVWSEEGVRGILVEGLKPGVSLTIDKGCGATYEHGEYLNVTVRSGQDGYLTLFDFMPDGRVQVIFPNTYCEDNAIQSEREYTIPGDLLPFLFQVVPPDGEEVLFAVVTEQPIELLSNEYYDLTKGLPSITQGNVETARTLIRRIEVIPEDTQFAVAMCHFHVGKQEATTPRDGWGLFIGVDDYDETPYTGEDGLSYYLPKLRYCVKGANEMAEALSLLFPNQRVLANREVTHDRVKQEITEWLSQASTEVTVLIYYSGHGSRKRDSNNDEADGYDETLVPWDYASKRQFIVDDELREWLLELKAHRVVLILDSCHSGTMERNALTARLLSTGSRATDPHLTDGIAEDFARPSTARGAAWKELVIAACRPDESAYESLQLRNGVLTHYLLEAVGGDGDADGDAWVTAQEAYKHVAEVIPARYPRQHPQLTDKIQDEVRLARTE